MIFRLGVVCKKEDNNDNEAIFKAPPPLPRYIPVCVSTEQTSERESITVENSSAMGV